MEAVHSICAEEKRADTNRRDVYSDAVLFAETAFKLINYTGIMLRIYMGSVMFFFISLCCSRLG